MRRPLLTVAALTLTTCTAAPLDPGTSGPAALHTTISGQILTADDLPAPNATVHLVRYLVDDRPPFILTTTSDATGNFHFDPITPIPPNATCFIDAFTPTSGLARTLLTADANTTPITLILTHPATLDGTITDPAGHPLANATLSLVAIHVRGLHPEGGIPWLNAWINFAPLPYTSATSAPDGSFHFTHIPANSLLFVRASHPSYVGTHAIAQSPGKPLAVHFQSPAGQITGRVLDTAGRPAPGIPVHSGRPLFSGNLDAVDATQLTDADGRYTLTSLAPNNYNLTVSLDPSKQTALPVSITAEPGKTISAPDIHIERGIPITGRVIYASTGEPLAPFALSTTVTVETQPPSAFSTHVNVALNGDFSLRLPPGSYHLQLQTSPPWYNDLASAWIDITETTPPKPLLLKATHDPNRPIPATLDLSHQPINPIVPAN